MFWVFVFLFGGVVLVVPILSLVWFCASIYKLATWNGEGDQVKHIAGAIISFSIVALALIAILSAAKNGIHFM
ncbi:MAG: hypothetical protein MJ238_00330 [Bacilli bacterium]|nr:hypothetical protein [Bacilli bacterium]